jgi:hypothetical protein
MKKSSGTNTGKGNSFYQKMLNKFGKNNQAEEKAWEENAIRSGKIFTEQYEMLEWSSDLVPVVGRLDMLFNPLSPDASRRVSVPVQSCFLVTGIIEKDSRYHMMWVSSMC